MLEDESANTGELMMKDFNKIKNLYEHKVCHLYTTNAANKRTREEHNGTDKINTKKQHNKNNDRQRTINQNQRQHTRVAVEQTREQDRTR